MNQIIIKTVYEICMAYLPLVFSPEEWMFSPLDVLCGLVKSQEESYSNKQNLHIAKESGGDEGRVMQQW